MADAPRLQDVPAFLETPGMDLGYDQRNMDRVRRLIAGRELPRTAGGRVHPARVAGRDTDFVESSTDLGDEARCDATPCGPRDDPPSPGVSPDRTAAGPP